MADEYVLCIVSRLTAAGQPLRDSLPPEFTLANYRDSSPRTCSSISVRCAVLVENGEILGELLPGTHTLDSLAERISFEPRRQTDVVVVREEEIPVELAETVLGTRDGRTVCACSSRTSPDRRRDPVSRKCTWRPGVPGTGRAAIPARACPDGSAQRCRGPDDAG